MRKDATEAVEGLTEALGAPVATPERVMAPDYRRTRRTVRAAYRIFRWQCPVCQAGDWLWRPFWADSEGNLGCDACHADERTVAREIAITLHARRVLEMVGL